MSQALRIAVVGAGLGGLTAAIALLRRGFDVTVYEQAPELGEIGAGVQIGPNAVKVFRALGIEDEISAAAVEPGSHILCNWRTGHINFETRQKGVFERKFGGPFYQIHRADLHEILRRHVPPERVRLNVKCVGVRNDGARAIVEFADGSQVESDVVVGADGIHSAVRACLLGPDSPRFTGNICWRGTVPAEALPRGLIDTNTYVWMGPHGHVVHYYVRGGSLVNFVAIYEADDWRQESWSTTADKAELLQTYAGWNSKLLTLFANAGRVNKWALYDRDPLPRWSDGRITLIGDAAHPMLPYLAQGACMAVEDGYALAGMLARDGASDIPATLKAFETVRLPRTSRVQLGARARAEINHKSSWLARLKRDMRLAYRRVFDREGTSYEAEWIYGYDVTREVA